MKILISKSALPLSLYRRFVKGWDKGRYADLFSKYSGDRNSYRIYLPITTTGKLVHIPVPADINQAVSDKGYQVDDYINGIAVDQSGKRRIKIGKLLSPELQQKFANDKQRQGARNLAAGGLCVISRHPYDVAGMSTGRGWTSCMNLIGGSNKHYVPAEVKEGSIIAYMVAKDDKNIQKPSARILMRVYQAADGKRGLFPASIYGSGSFEFSAVVNRWCSEINRDYFNIPYGQSLKLLNNLYEDDGLPVRVMKKHDPEADGEAVARAIINGSESIANQNLMEYIQAYAGTNLTPILSKLPITQTIKFLNSLSSVLNATFDLDPKSRSEIYSTALSFIKAKGDGPYVEEEGDLYTAFMAEADIAAVSYWAYPDSTLGKDAIDFLFHMSGSNRQSVYRDLLDGDRNITQTLIDSYTEVGYDPKTFADVLIQEEGSSWATFDIPDPVLKHLTKYAKAQGPDLLPAFIGILKPQPLAKFFKELYSSKVSTARVRGLAVTYTAALATSAADAFVLKTDPAKFSGLWRGDSVLPAMALPLDRSLGTPNFYQLTSAIGLAFNKFAAIDSKREFAFTRQLVTAEDFGHVCKICTPQFLAQIEAKNYASTLVQAFAYNISVGESLDDLPALAPTASYLKSVPELFALFAPVALGLTDELQKAVLQALFKNQNFAYVCMRNSAALERKFPTMYQSKITGFFTVIESIAVNEEDEDVLYKLKDLGLSDAYFPMIRNLEKLML